MEGPAGSFTRINTLQILSSLTPEQINKLLKVAESKEENEKHEYETDVSTLDKFSTYVDEYNRHVYKYNTYRVYDSMGDAAKFFVKQAINCNDIVRKYKYKKFYAIVDWKKCVDVYLVHPIAYYTEDNFPYNIQKLTHAQNFIGIDTEKRRHDRDYYSFVFYVKDRYSSFDKSYLDYYGIYENPLPNLTIFDVDTLAFNM